MSEMKKTLRIALIGCGGIANGKHMPALKTINEVEMVAFCDIIKERAEKAAKEYGIEGAGVYTDYKEMIDVEKPDVVHVCTPNKSHAAHTIYALEHNCHVMCEKPMAKTYADALEMYEAYKKSGKKLSIGYQYRCNPTSQYVHDCCEKGDLGDIYFAKANATRRRGVPTWGVFLNEEEQGGGPLIDIGTHALDLTLWCMNNYDVKSVKGSVFKKLGNQTNTANIWGDWDTEKYTVEDSAFGFITMKNGATIILESSWALNMIDCSEANCTLCGTKAGADFKDGVRINYVKNNRQCIEKPDMNVGGVAFYDGIQTNPKEVDARQWIDAILNDTEPLVKPEQALVVTRVLEAIYNSAKTGKEIVFED